MLFEQENLGAPEKAEATLCEAARVPIKRWTLPGGASYRSYQILLSGIWYFQVLALLV